MISLYQSHVAGRASKIAWRKLSEMFSSRVLVSHLGVEALRHWDIISCSMWRGELSARQVCVLSVSNLPRRNARSSSMVLHCQNIIRLYRSTRCSILSVIISTSVSSCMMISPHDRTRSIPSSVIGTDHERAMTPFFWLIFRIRSISSASASVSEIPAKCSAGSLPVVSQIYVSVSIKGLPSIVARSLPIVDLPTHGIPRRIMFRIVKKIKKISPKGESFIRSSLKNYNVVSCDVIVLV